MSEDKESPQYDIRDASGKCSEGISKSSEEIGKIGGLSKFFDTEKLSKKFSAIVHKDKAVVYDPAVFDPCKSNITTTTTSDGITITTNGSDFVNTTGGDSSGSMPIGDRGLGGFGPIIRTDPSIYGGGTTGGDPMWSGNTVFNTPNYIEILIELKKAGLVNNSDININKVIDELKKEFGTMENFIKNSSLAKRELFLDLIKVQLKQLSLLTDSQVEIVAAEHLKGKLALQITIDMPVKEFFSEGEDAEPFIKPEEKEPPRVVKIEEDKISFK